MTRLLLGVTMITACAVDGPTLESIAGSWSAEGYSCPVGELPETELISISNTGNTVTATKTLGDACVPTGMMTWQGIYDRNPFAVEVTIGIDGAYSSESGQITVVSARDLELTAGDATVVYTR